MYQGYTFVYRHISYIIHCIYTQAYNYKHLLLLYYSISTLYIGKAYVGICICCIQIVSQLIQSFGRRTPRRTLTSTTTPNIESLDQYILIILHIVCITCNSTGNSSTGSDLSTSGGGLGSVRSGVTLGEATPAPFAIMTSTCALLLQCLTSLQEYYTETTQTSKTQIQYIFNMHILPHIYTLPIEIHALLICCADQIFPSNIASNITLELYNLSTLIIQTSQATTTTNNNNNNNNNSIELLLLSHNSNTNTSNINSISRYSACLDSLARHYSILTPTERQRFIHIVLPLQECLGPLIACIINTIYQLTSTQYNTNSSGSSGIMFISATYISKYNSLLQICILLLSLLCGLQQSLGKTNTTIAILAMFCNITICMCIYVLLIIYICVYCYNIYIYLVILCLLYTYFSMLIGKKHFGQCSIQALDVCISYLLSPSSSSTTSSPTHVGGNIGVGNSGSGVGGGGGHMIVIKSNIGIRYIKQLLNLTNVIALSSSASASTAIYQVSLTEKLLSYICTYLTDPAVCAELLGDTIKTGM